MLERKIYDALHATWCNPLCAEDPECDEWFDQWQSGVEFTADDIKTILVVVNEWISNLQPEEAMTASGGVVSTPSGAYVGKSTTTGRWPTSGATWTTSTGTTTVLPGPTHHITVDRGGRTTATWNGERVGRIVADEINEINVTDEYTRTDELEAAYKAITREKRRDAAMKRPRK